MMRTTLNIPDDVYEAARSVAAVKGISLGDAIADLVRQSLNSTAQIDTRKPFPCFPARKGAKPITLEQTLRAEDEL